MDAWITIGTKIDTKSFDAQIEKLEEDLKDLEDEYEQAMSWKGFPEDELLKYEQQIEKTKNKIIDLQKKQADLESQKFTGVRESMSGIGNSTEKLIKKIAKWSLAIFSIRSAYQFVRQSVGTLAQYNEKIGTDIEYIRFALASTLQPIIEWMIKAVYTLMAYVKYLAKELFNIDLFSNASSKNFNKMNKSAKELKNTLAGFDEMNVLGDQSGGGNVKTPTMDLSKSLGDVEIPQWLKIFAEIVRPITDWMKDVIKNEGVVGVLKSILAVLGGFVILKTIASMFTGLFTKDISAGVNNFLTSFGKATEIIAILGGLALAIQEIADLITAFAESGLSLQEVGILLAEVLGGIAAAFIVLAAATKLMDWKGIAAATVILAGMSAVILSLTKLIDAFAKSGLELDQVGILLAEVIGTIIALVVTLTAAAMLLQNPLAMGGLAVLAASICAILLVMAETLPKILDAVGKFINQVAPVVIQLLTTIGNIINTIIVALGKTLPPIINSVGGAFKTIFEGIAKVIQTVGNSLNDILSGVGGLTKTVLGSILSFIERLGPAINTFVDNAITAVTKLINFMVSGIEYLVNTLVVGGVNKIIDGINSVGKYVGITIGRIDKMSIPRFRPRLAKGGIVNMPGKGVPLGGATIGETGPEGVIPFTDQAQMQMIGEEIGKWVTINVTNVTQLDGRELSRKVEKISANRQFANGR